MGNLAGVPMVGAKLCHDDDGRKYTKHFKVKITHGRWIELVDTDESDPDVKRKVFEVKCETDKPFIGLTFGYLYKKMAESGDAVKHFNFGDEFSIVCLTQTQEPKIIFKEDIPYEYIDEL